MQVKTIPFECKVDVDARTIEGYASVFGNVDNGNDRVLKGAFTKTIQERFIGKTPPAIKMLWQHYQPLGLPTMLAEDEHGLAFKAVVSKTALGDEALTLMADGVVSQMSFGFDLVKSVWEEQGEGKADIRNLTEVKLWEISPVTFGMNEETAITAVVKMLEGVPLNDEAKGLLILAARLGAKTIGSAGLGKTSKGEATAAELIGGFDERMQGLVEDFAKLKALIESGQPVKLTTGENDEPLKFDASVLDPWRQLSEFFNLN